MTSLLKFWLEALHIKTHLRMFVGDQKCIFFSTNKNHFSHNGYVCKRDGFQPDSN